MTDLDTLPDRFSDWDPARLAIERPEQCDRCRRRWADSASCDAFPAGIPVQILSGEHDHLWRFPGDRGIRFRALDHPGGKRRPMRRSAAPTAFERMNDGDDTR